MATYRTYQEDSDADDEYERSVITSPTLPPDCETSPTDSEPPSAEHTPTTFTHSADSYVSPKGVITTWTSEQVADWISNLGLGHYAATFLDENVDGDALVALQHADLKELGISSVGHRLTVLKGVYDVKVKQNVPLDPDHYVPLSAETQAQETAPTQDDIARIIEIIKDRDDRIRLAESELRSMRDDLSKMAEENRKLREDVLPMVREAKNRSQPLPTPDAQERDNHHGSPPERSGSTLSRKFSTKKLFLGSAPKNPSPTIHEGRTLADTSNLDPSAAAMAASNHLTASLNNNTLTGSTLNASPHPPQPSPTSPAYSTHAASRSRRDHGDDGSSYHEREAAIATRSGSRRERDRDRERGDGNEPLSAGRNPETASLAPSTAGSSNNPQVEIFKSFRVSIDDPCHKVLPVALKKYNITADWRQYALYIVHGDQERCLGLNEKPLILFKQLDRDGRKPMFMLRKHAAPIEGHSSTINPGGPGGYGAQGVAEGLPGGVL
ncbi:uncharacterized protein IWZ02DRAFT_69239 [Phyllosticta citriasiana]|uniref:RA-domain-containing protein n=1 Tax=Phyllosticta citriasiana TaxID=595635 RepID=A0ABR1K8R3_9PEZI